MNQTTNYKLNQWQRHDRVLMDDFNADNAKIDAALKAEADARTAADTAERTARETAVAAIQTTLNTHTAQIAKLGNCQIYTTTYMGNGKYGEKNKNSLTFPHKPLLVLLCETGRTVHLFNGCTSGYYQSGSSGYNSVVSWNGNTVSWSCSESATGQMNSSHYVYYVVALLVKE